MSWMRSTRISSLPLWSSLSYSRQAQESTSSQFTFSLCVKAYVVHISTFKSCVSNLSRCSNDAGDSARSRQTVWSLGTRCPWWSRGTGRSHDASSTEDGSLGTHCHCCKSFCESEQSLSILLQLASDDKQLTAQELKVEQHKNNDLLSHTNRNNAHPATSSAPLR